MLIHCCIIYQYALVVVPVEVVVYVVVVVVVIVVVVVVVVVVVAAAVVVCVFEHCCHNRRSRGQHHTRMSVFNSSPVHAFEPFFWTSQLLDNFRRFLTPIHTSCRSRDVVFTLMMLGCTRAICELKGIYNV